jgi:protein-tyrosine-phosphatase
VKSRYAAQASRKQPEMSTPRRILLLLGSSHAGGLEACRSLGRAGHRVSVLRLCRDRTLADYSRFCDESLYLGLIDGSVRDQAVRLGELLRSGQYDYLLPMDDLALELIYRSGEDLSSRTRVVGPTAAAYASARNGWAMLAVAEAAGLTHAEAILVKRGEAHPPRVSYPCVVRPTLAHLILDDEPQCLRTREVRDAIELDAKLRDDLCRVDVMLQAPMGGTPIEVAACAIDGEVLGASLAVDVWEPVGGTRGGYARIGELTPEALRSIRSIADNLSWTGMLLLEGRIGVGGDLAFVRLSGKPRRSMILAEFSGVNLLALLIDGLEGKRHSTVVLPTRTIWARNLRRDCHWLSRQLATSSRTAAVWAWMRSFGRVLVRRECFEIERLNDPVPAMRQFDGTLKRMCHKVTLRFSSAFRQATRERAAVIGRTSSILVVCKGNINRSVVAEQLFRARGFTRVWSAGLLDVLGRRPSQPAEAFLKDRLGVDASRLRSRSVRRALREIGTVDMVICFERSQVAEMLRRCPSFKGKVFLLSTLAGEGQRRPDVSDPHGGSAEKYRECFEQIERLIDRIVASAPDVTRTSSPYCNRGADGDNGVSVHEQAGGRVWR